MPYGTVKVDNITFTNNGVDTTITVSGLAESTTGNLTVTGTISGSTANFVSGSFSTRVSGLTVAGTTGTFTSLTGTTTQGTTATFTTGSFTSLTGTTTTGTTANFVSGVFTTQVSGATITGTTVAATTGTFTTVTGGVITITSGVFALGSAAAPSISFSGDADNGIYSPGANQVAISTSGTGRLFVTSSGLVGIGTSAPNAPLCVNGLPPQAGVISAVAAAQGRSLALSDNINCSLYVSHLAGGALIGTDSGNAIRFATNGFNSSDEKVRITNTGLVGIGTSTPGYILDCSQSANTDVAVNVTNSNASSGAIAEFRASNGTNSAWYGIGGTGYTPYAQIRPNGAAIYTSSAAGIGLSADNASGYITFGTGSGASERMMLDSSGRLLIGTSSIVVGSPQTIIEKSSSDLDILRVQCKAESANNLAGIAFGFAANGARPKTAIASVAAGTFGRGSLAFYVDQAFDNNSVSSSDEVARFDTSGRLLIGTSTARANFYNGTDTGIFQVEGANDITKRFSSFIYGRDNSDGPLLLLGKHRGTSVGGTTVVASGDEIGRITFQGSDGTQFVAGAEIQAYVDGTPGADDMPGRLVFSTTADGASSPTERMMISQDGHVSIGVTSIYSSAYRVSVACTGSNGGIIVRAASTDTAFPLSFENSSGTQVGSITNSTTATAFNTSSDYRLKENIVPVSDGISRLQQLKPCRFNFIAEPAKTVDGFLAHEVEGLVPEAITGIKDATDSNGNPIYQAIDQSKLVPLLTAALQEAVARIEQLETAVATLQGS